MRSLVCALMVLAVASVQLTKMNQFAQGSELAKVANTGIGKALLLEMQSKVDSGLPIDELERVIADVRARIVAAQAADNKQHTQRQENCTADIARYTENIAQAERDISRTKSEINTAEAEWDGLVAKIANLETQIVQLDGSVEDLMKKIDEGRAHRASEHAQFVDRSTDTTSVIAAIEEIKGVETGSSLKEYFPDADEEHTAQMTATNADTDATGRHNGPGDIEAEEAADQAKGATVSGVNSTTVDINNERMYAYKDAAFLHLSSLAKKAKDPTTKSFLEVAANAASALSGSDYENLERLLNQLLDELRMYTEQLIRDEKTQAVDWADLENRFTRELRSKQEMKHAKQVELETAYRTKKNTAQQIHDLRNDLDQYTQTLADNQRDLADRTAECNEFRRQHAANQAERDEQLSTLNTIENILTHKLKATLQGNAAVSTGVNAGV